MTHSRVSPVWQWIFESNDAKNNVLVRPRSDDLIYCILHYTKEILLASDKGVLMHRHCVNNHVTIAGEVYLLSTLSPYVRRLIYNHMRIQAYLNGLSKLVTQE